ncbi:MULTISPECIES: arrestin family protein [unclassified Haladaptatus]|uniref:arrestin family protein n=1 Tax=unclassified Haladaptatus TaxID=2622732 RepID=UPI00209BF92A|nr:MULTISPECIES: arrestin family protein [unclassified Haladaptatus]MCO8246555.1 arrestin family protein [Haladaptatus sp. AB643]MCO8254793.1 arrestin family protein [Haladaptatus sp. AB618]
MERRDSDDQFGFDENVNYMGRALRALVPQRVARRSISVSVSTPDESYEIGDEIPITVTFDNRSPFPVVVETPQQRLWGWEVNGELEASDETYYVRNRPNAFYFRAREKKRASVTWDGWFQRENEPTRRVAADPGEYTVAAYLATENERPRGETTITLR